MCGSLIFDGRVIMAEQHVFIWTGRQPGDTEGCRQLANALPLLPPPAPPARAAHIEYYWGDAKLDIWAIACSVRNAAWGGAPMTWLHCKAMNVAEIVPHEPTGLMTI
jgi:hypothetical protein